MWATLGLIRGVFSLKGSGRAFCEPQWVELMMHVIRKASPLNQYSSPTKSLVQQVCPVESGGVALFPREGGGYRQNDRKYLVV